MLTSITAKFFRRFHRSPSFLSGHFPISQLHKRMVDGESLRSSYFEPLVDTFNRRHDYVRISLTERCNLRCNYCMPASGVKLSSSSQLLSSDELIRLVHVLARAGVRKLRLTGGEPLIRKDVVSLVEQITALPGIESVSMTTNGLLLPRRASELRKAGLDQLNVSLDTLKPERFEHFTRRLGWHRVWHGIQTAMSAGFSPLKLNVVVMRSENFDELLDFVSLTESLPIDVRFIEFMPFTGNEWNSKQLVPYSEMLQLVRNSWPQLTRLTNKASDTAKSYRVEGWQGQIGFISSMTDNFCSGCNRLRITADGNLKVCLFGNSEISLRDALRAGMSDEELLEIVRGGVMRKRKQHAGMENLASARNRPMILIGG